MAAYYNRAGTKEASRRGSGWYQRGEPFRECEAQLRVAKVSAANLLVSLEHRVWGAESARFGDWKVGQFVAFMTDEGLSALAKVSGPPFESNLMIWERAVYRYRIPVDFVTLLPEDLRKQLGADIRSLLRERLGSGYGMRILKQSLLPLDVSGAVLDLLREHSILVE